MTMTPIQVRMIQLVLAAAIAVFAPCGPAMAQAPAAENPLSPRFDINRFEVVGNTLLRVIDIDAAVAPYIGTHKDFSDIQRALEALERTYHDRGFGVAHVLLPEQNITLGVVRMRVIEPKVAKVVIEGNKHFDDANVRHSLPTIKEGATPNSTQIARNLTMLGEHPLKQTTVVLRAGATDDQLDVNVKLEDDKPWRAVLSLDNTGTGETGYWRSGIGFQHSNLFNRDHSLNFQYITSPTQPSDVSIYGLGYHIPFYALNGSLDLIAGYSNVNSGTVQGLFSVAGSGTIFGARWNYYLPKWGELEQKLTLGLDYRGFRNDVSLAGVGGLVPDITIHPISLTYNGLLRGAASQLGFYATAAANIPGGNDGASADFERSRAGATDNYTVFRYGLNFVKALPSDWQARIAVNGQYTSNALVAGEQFGLGGPDSVRGYVLREVANDRGYNGQLELYTPDLSPRLGLSENYKARLLAFYDFGSVERNHALPGEVTSASIASAGIGARVGYGKALSLRFDLARIAESTAVRQAGDFRVGVAAAITF